MGVGKARCGGEPVPGNEALVQERVSGFVAGLDGERDEVKRRCRTLLQSKARGVGRNPPPTICPASGHPRVCKHRLHKEDLP